MISEELGEEKSMVRIYLLKQRFFFFNKMMEAVAENYTVSTKKAAHRA